MRLEPPQAAHQASYLAAWDEFGEATRDGDGDLEWWDAAGARHTLTRADLADPAGFADFVAYRRRLADPATPRRPGWVPCTFLWMIDDDGYAGSLAIRHRLTEFLLREGGHIGYSVRPSARRRGYATSALRQALLVCPGLGINPVLVTCDEDNVGSRRVIEACGGVYEDSRVGTRRYWIDVGTGA